VVEQWLEDVLVTEILPDFSLAMLPDQDRINELAFAYPLDSLDQAAFNRILTEYGFAPLPGDEKTLQGLLVGFIDLVFRQRGVYCIADYKSNHLGDDAADYGPERLAKAMRVHRYDLQYLFYTLALHRTCKAACPTMPTRPTSDRSAIFSARHDSRRARVRRWFYPTRPALRTLSGTL